MCASARSNARTMSPALCWVRTVRVTLAEELVGSAAGARHEAFMRTQAGLESGHHHQPAWLATAAPTCRHKVHTRQTFRWHMASCPRRPVKAEAPAIQPCMVALTVTAALTLHTKDWRAKAGAKVGGIRSMPRAGHQLPAGPELQHGAVHPLCLIELPCSMGPQPQMLAAAPGN